MLGLVLPTLIAVLCDAVPNIGSLQRSTDTEEPDSSGDELDHEDDDDNDDLLSAAVAAVEAEDKESKRGRKRFGLLKKGASKHVEQKPPREATPGFDFTPHQKVIVTLLCACSDRNRP